MKIWKIIRELAASGIVPLLSGSYILLTAPGAFWAFIGAGFVCIGVFYGYTYTKKTTQDNGGVRTQ